MKHRVACRGGVRIGPLLEKVDGQISVTAERSDDKRGHAVGRGGVDVGARFDEQSGKRRRVDASRNQQRREAALRTGMNVCTGVDQRPCHGGVGVTRGPHQRRLAPRHLGGVRVGSSR